MKKHLSPFPESYEMALKRLYYVENQMARNSEYASACVLIAAHWSAKYKREGIRIVFDAAAEVQNVSLSKCLLRGPDFNNTLISTIFKFREAPVAVCGDIKEMFHQIKIAKEDQDCQRFLWRNGDQNKKVEVYVMQRMIFGVTCSPTIAQFIENLNAQRFLEEVPRAVHGIIDRHYVDDYVECFDTEDEAVSVVKDVIKIHSASGFELRNIISNLERVVRSCGQSASGGNSYSRTVIRWIRSDHRKFKEYVANRMADILDSSEMDSWNWCPGSKNPANGATRAKFPIKYEADGRWTNGPEFLHMDES
ncbi:uncharacterized protein LOC106090843 isoform X3 [Stomoxys calcitrans]|uniref:Reverse transcriptase domain-containing protein n=1 Tax=Stomoxys calcitrans TaxID=35570 RepID=A0A1I8Q088_STOCA|nr:uncharacterized protein LOC106090843 isoform X3 [Stomoxys calcitrans]